MQKERSRCPPGYHKDESGTCRDAHGNPFVEGQGDFETMQTHQSAEDSTPTEHEQQVSYDKQHRERYQKLSQDVKSFVRNVKSNAFKQMLDKMGLGGLYGLFAIPVTAVANIVGLVSNQFEKYYADRQAKDKLTNYHVGYGEALVDIYDSFDINKFKTPEQVKDFYQRMDKKLEDLYNSKAVRNKDKTSKEYGQLMAYFMILRQTKDKIDAWNKAGFEKFGKEFKPCDYADDLKMFNELAKLRPRKNKTKAPKQQGFTREGLGQMLSQRKT